MKITYIRTHAAQKKNPWAVEPIGELVQVFSDQKYGLIKWDDGITSSHPLVDIQPYEVGTLTP